MCIKAISQARKPLVIARLRSPDHRVSALQVGVAAEIHVQRRIDEERLPVGSIAGGQVLAADLSVPHHSVAEVPGQGQHFVVALGETAVEFRITEIGAKSRSSYLLPRDAFHRVQRPFLVSSLIALPQRPIKEEMTNRFYASADAKTLIQQFVDQPGADELRGS